MSRPTLARPVRFFQAAPAPRSADPDGRRFVGLVRSVHDAIMSRHVSRSSCATLTCDEADSDAAGEGQDAVRGTPSAIAPDPAISG